jgi:serine/threonine-protein kinase
MTLAAGTRLGPYEVAAPIGAGGMGEVYRARDTRLGRNVALKVLPAEFLADPARLGRFEQEARSASALNHPNIVTVHDVGRAEATAYFAMELVEGKTLRELLTPGALPLKRTLSIAAQVADALAAAHSSGIVHRDLKPENVMVTAEGRVKVLDFGLAKLLPAGAEGGSQLPTVAGARTESGVVLGTVDYMSPEQARGSPVDFRSDQFSFGSVLYEMATGRRPFQRDSAAQTLAAIIEDEPEPIGSRNPKVPPALGWIVERCLAKDPEGRYGSTGDLAREIAHTRDQAGSARAAGPAGGPSTGRVPREWVRLAGAAILGALAVAAVWRFARAGPLPRARPQRLTLTLPSNAPIEVASLGPSLALSPDGSRLVYVAESGGIRQLFLRPLDQSAPAPIAGTQGAWAPFFSPDGHWVGFFSNGKLKKVPLAGGVAIAICDAENGSASWGDDDTVVFESAHGLASVSAAGGTPRTLVTADAKKGETYLNSPSLLPGRRAVLFAVWTGGSMGEQPIVVQSLETGARQVLPVKGAWPRYAATGHVVFARDDLSLMAAPFDLSRLEVTGPPVPVAEGVLLYQPSGVAQYAFSDNGSLVYVGSSEGLTEGTMVWVDRRGKAEPLSSARHDFEMPRISPDGQRVAVGFDGEVWVHEIARGTFTRLTFGGGAGQPVWTPDGRSLAFISTTAGPINQFRVSADGSGSPERLVASEHAQFVESFAPDGQHLAFMDIDPETGNDLWVLPLEGERKAKPLVRTPYAERGATFSPDGRWVAYTSNASGSWQVYVQPYGRSVGKSQVSSDGGTEAVWARDGRELFYRNGDRMMVVAVKRGDELVAGKPSLLFEGRYAMGPVEGFTNYDVSRDGQRFLMIKSEQPSAPTQLNVVLNWFEDLEHRTGAAKRP